MCTVHIQTPPSSFGISHRRFWLSMSSSARLRISSISGSYGAASGSGSQIPAIASGSRSQLPTIATLSMKDRNDLKILYDGLKGIMEELDALLKKYQRLSENHSISFDRLKWGQEDLVGLRERLRSNITLLTTFNASLAKYVPLYLPLYLDLSP